LTREVSASEDEPQLPYEASLPEPRILLNKPPAFAIAPKNGARKSAFAYHPAYQAHLASNRNQVSGHLPQQPRVLDVASSRPYPVTSLSAFSNSTTNSLRAGDRTQIGQEPVAEDLTFNDPNLNVSDDDVSDSSVVIMEAQQEQPNQNHSDKTLKRIEREFF
jgi:hypothetical protein